jgi:hypothetical protein
LGSFVNTPGDSPRIINIAYTVVDYKRKPSSALFALPYPSSDQARATVDLVIEFKDAGSMLPFQELFGIYSMFHEVAVELREKKYADLHP